MDFLISRRELDALYALPHIQQLTYLRGIRPFMDCKTALVGIKRGVSHQSIAEELHVNPAPGIKGSSCSRMQVRRALKSLERAGLIEVRSEDLRLIIECKLVTSNFSVRKKADINPTQLADIDESREKLVTTSDIKPSTIKPDIGDSQKADTPLIKDNYIYFLSQQFEKFWSLYPEKKSKSVAREVFMQLAPDDVLFTTIMKQLTSQIEYRSSQQAQGTWVPPWKYPANWLQNRSWEDEVNLESLKEHGYAANRKGHQASASRDPFYSACLDEEPAANNVIAFRKE